MNRSPKRIIFAVVGSAFVIALCGAACQNDRWSAEADDHVDVHPPSGTEYVTQISSGTGWQATAVGLGPDQGAELHLENSGKHVLLPDAAPLGFSPDGKLLLLVWTPQGSDTGGLAVIPTEGGKGPRMLTDASRLPTPGRAEDIRWSGHRIEYDLPGEDERRTVMVDLESGAVTTRPMGQKGEVR